MKGDAEVVDLLNELLTFELTAINQYYIHYKMCRNWGYERTASRFKDEAMDEMKHADAMIERILFFEGIPNMQRLNPVKVGENVPEQLKLALATELEARDLLNRGVALCRDRGDNGTRDMLEEMVRAEEEAIDWLEAQLGIIEEIGRERYLAEMIH